MAFTKQDDDGTVDGANAYVGPEDVRAYWLDRGVDLSSKTDAELQVAIVLATGYLDARYSWVGYQLRRLQGTQWPRGGTPGTEWPMGTGPQFLRGLPPALRNATCAVANRALAGVVLLPDPAPRDPSGQRVTESTVKVGPVEKSLKFADDGAKGALSLIPELPEVTLMLKAGNLVESSNSGRIVRG